MAELHCRRLQDDIDQYEKTTEKMVDKTVLKQQMVDKAHFGFPDTSAKRYLRQLAEFGYLEAHGGNRNRTYRK